MDSSDDDNIEELFETDEEPHSNDVNDNTTSSNGMKSNEMRVDACNTLQNVENGTFVIVNVPTATQGNYGQYIAQVVEIPSNQNHFYDVLYLRRKGEKFVWPSVQDKDTINTEQIQLVLSKPDVLKRGFRFNSNELEGYLLR